ncbi:MAG TPA: hypothetical protein VJJ98_14775 [Sedimentisphaerales bacterium]|nr:hypothetical protein [Sedimentisphaerales bacterium]
MSIWKRDEIMDGVVRLGDYSCLNAALSKCKPRYGPIDSTVKQAQKITG